MQKHINKIWRLGQKNPALQAILARELGISEIVAQILINRGVLTVEEARAFLHNDLTSLHDPFLLRDMEAAVRIIVEILQNEQKIVVFGDYDVDGITSSSLLVKVLRELGARAEYYLPDRLKEGYGLNKDAVKRLAEQGFSLMITVDCGISCPEETALAASLGMKVIITDHHEPPESLPQADAVINPKQHNCPYPFKELAGVGVAFKLAQALYKTLCPLEEARVLEHLDLVALGTVADIVALKGENRILVKYGLPRIGPFSGVGLRALIDVCGLAGKELTAGQVGYTLAPRLNAAGRMGSASLGAELLLTEDTARAAEIAHLLNEENARRQKTEEEICQEAIAMLEQEGGPRQRRIILLAGKWHSGVIGIVASRLVEKYYLPVVMVALEDDMGKGSARSIPGFNLHEALTVHQQYLEKFGGHNQAAGFSVKPENIPALRQALEAYADTVITEDMLIPSLELDSLINLNDIDFGLLEQLEKLAPFGHQNRGPTLACQGASVVQSQGVGTNGAHLKIRLRSTRGLLDGIGFNLGSYQESLASGETVDLAFALDRNTWQGRTTVQLQLKDIKHADIAGSGKSGIPDLKPFREIQALETLNLGDQLFVEGAVNLNEDDSCFQPERFPLKIAVPKKSFQIIDQRQHPIKLNYLRNLLKGSETTLIYVSSPYAAVELASVLRLSSGLSDVFYCHGGMAQGKARELLDKLILNDELKILVTTPYFPVEELQTSFGQVVFYSLPANWAQFTSQIRAVPGKDFKLHLLFGERDVPAIEEALAKRHLDREILGKLYLYIKAQTQKENPYTTGFDGFCQGLLSQSQFEPEKIKPGIVRLGLTVLEELKLITWAEKGGRLSIRLMPAPGTKLDLELSPAYKAGSKDLSLFRQFRQLVLQTPMDTIENLLKTSF